MRTLEMNFDGLVGPTHNYAGLSFGNVASSSNKGFASNPRAAALQGLTKMRALLEMGLPQGVFPPQERPFIPGLRELGHTGTDGQVLERAFANHPMRAANFCSASAMWTANAATISPSADTADGRVHLTTANLAAMPHRAIEGPQTERLLRAVFKDSAHFAVYAPLAGHVFYGDEGAANHNRLCASHEQAGLEMFVFGREVFGAPRDLYFPARQTLEASAAIAAAHGLNPERVLMLAQSERAINAGAFHNDVVCVTNETVMFYHADAFENADVAEDVIRGYCAPLDFAPVFLRADAKALPLEAAIKSYVFNSQLLTRPDGGMSLILPIEAQECEASRRFVEASIAADGPLDSAHFLDLRQSMSNGGGPACLRLRVQLTPAQLAAVHDGVIMDAHKIDRLEAWVKTHYRDRLSLEDLGDAKFLTETREALDALTQILNLGALYDFQR